LKDLWLDRLIAILIANSSKLPFGQEVLHDDLQGLDYDLGDMYTLNLKIYEDVEFQSRINAKLNSVKFFLSLQTNTCSKIP
jgi:hypothetical protein